MSKRTGNMSKRASLIPPLAFALLVGLLILLIIVYVPEVNKFIRDIFEIAFGKK